MSLTDPSRYYTYWCYHSTKIKYVYQIQCNAYKTLKLGIYFWKLSTLRSLDMILVWLHPYFESSLWGQSKKRTWWMVSFKVGRTRTFRILLNFSRLAEKFSKFFAPLMQILKTSTHHWLFAYQSAFWNSARKCSNSIPIHTFFKDRIPL